MRITQTCVLLSCLALSGLAYPNPTLTTIEDIVFRADGSRFNGTAYVQWRAFNSSDASTIGTSQVAVPIRDGILSVKLVPTVNSVGGAFYTVRYQSEGRFQFSEVWTVPASVVPIKLKDVKVPLASGSSGSLGSGPVQLGDVVGLAEELALRPTRSTGFTPSRALATDATGGLTSVTGSLGDCVRVDGTSGPCGTPISFVDLEVPTGVLDGANRNYNLSGPPNPASSLHLYRNGILQRTGVDFTLSGSTITFLAVSTPQSGDLLQASYRR